MKLKTLLVSAAALLCSAASQKLQAAAADYLSGWTEVTSMPVDLAEWSNYYYVFVATEADLMLAQEQGGSLDGDQQESKLTVVYRTPGDPSIEKKFVWMIDYDNTYLYGIRSLNNTTYYMQTREKQTYRVQFAWETAQSKWTKWDLVYADSKWTIQNKLADGDGGGDNNWIGPWNTGAFQNNMVAAGNAGGNGNPKGTFKIYRIPCKDYISNVTNTYITNANLKDIAANSTTDGEFWPVYTDGRTGNTQHPKNWYLHTNGTTNHNGGGEYFECWTANQGVKRWTLFQDVTLPAGSYKLTGQYSTNENRGIIKTVAITPHHTYVSPGITSSNWESWGSQTAEFTIYETTKVRVGMISTNFAQNHGFTLTTTTAHQFLADEIEAAPSALTSAIATAQGVYDNKNAGDDAYRTAAKNLHDAVVAYELSIASSSNPVDMTDKIANPSFEGVGGATDYTGANHACSEWTYCTSTDKGSYSATNKNHLITDDSNDGFYYINLWKNVTTYFAKQTLTSLPAGRYKLTALYASDPSNTATLYMGSVSEGTTVTATAKDHFVEGSVVYDLQEGGNVEIGIESTSWLKADGFRLQYLSSPATDADYTALNAAIEAGDAKVIGFEAGEYAPYNNIEAIALLEAAKSIDQNAYNTHEDVQAAIESLNAAWTANDGEVNAIAGGYNLDSFTNNGTYDLPNGWSNTGYNTRIVGISESLVGENPGLGGAVNTRAILVKFSTTYGETDGYTLPLKSDTWYALSFKYGLWDESIEITKNLSLTDPNGDEIIVYPNSVSKNEGDTEKCANVLTTAWYDKTVWFKTTDDGDYILKIQGDNNQRQMVFSGLMLKKAVAANTTISETTAEIPAIQYANVTLTRTLTGGQWNGFSLPFSLSAEQIAASSLNGATIKQWASVSENVITLEDATEIVAGDPYLVKPESDILNPIFNGVIVENPSEAVKGDGDYTLQAHLYNTALPTDGSIAYVSTTDSSIKKLTSGGIKGLRAIFNIPTATSVKALTVNFGDDTTGILSVDADGNITESGAIYNLAGQRLSKAQKGVNIIIGKKVIIK